MSEPKRERIMENWLARLKTIKTVNGYYITPKNVSRDVAPLNELQDANLPVLFTFEGNETVKPHHIGMASKSVSSSFTVMTVGYFARSVMEKASAATLLNRARFDILKCLLADVSFGGLAIGLVPESEITATSDMLEFIPKVKLEIEFTVEYREDMT